MQAFYRISKMAGAAVGARPAMAPLATPAMAAVLRSSCNSHSSLSHATSFGAMSAARSTLGQAFFPAAQLRGFSSAAGSELDQLPEAMRRMLSLDNASQMEKNKHEIRRAIQDFQRHPGDTGSSEVQIAILSERIKYMTRHVQEHRKDKHNNKGLVQMVQDRRKLLKYLKRDNLERYQTLIERLGIRDSINLMPPRVFLPAKAAEAAAQRERQRVQKVEQNKKKMEKAEALRKSFRDKKLAKD